MADEPPTPPLPDLVHQLIGTERRAVAGVGLAALKAACDAATGASYGAAAGSALGAASQRALGRSLQRAGDAAVDKVRDAAAHLAALTAALRDLAPAAAEDAETADLVARLAACFDAQDGACAAIAADADRLAERGAPAMQAYLAMWLMEPLVDAPLVKRLSAAVAAAHAMGAAR